MYVGDTEPVSSGTTEQNTVCTFYGSTMTTAPEGQTIHCEQPVTGRYIIIQRAALNTPLVLCEVQPLLMPGRAEQCDHGTLLAWQHLLRAESAVVPRVRS